MLFKPILALHIMNFSSCQNYWGGGGKTICFPPQDRRLWRNEIVTLYAKDDLQVMVHTCTPIDIFYQITRQCMSSH